MWSKSEKTYYMEPEKNRQNQEKKELFSFINSGLKNIHPHIPFKKKFQNT